MDNDIIRMENVSSNNIRGLLIFGVIKGGVIM